MKQIKTNLIIAIIIILSCDTFSALAQSWSLTGNSGTTNSNFLGTTDSKKLSIRTNNKNRITISSGGSVGIGTTSPTDLLHVNGGALRIDQPATAQEYIVLNSTGLGNTQIHFRQNDVSQAIIHYDQSGQAFGINVKSPTGITDFNIQKATGYVGIGDNVVAQERLQVGGKVRIDRAYPDTYFLQLNTTNLGNALIQFTEGGIQTADMGFDHSTSTLRFSATSTGTRPDLCVLSSNGNVGVGTSNPGAKLHLYGGDFEITNSLNNFLFRVNPAGQLDIIPNGSTDPAAMTIDDGNSNVGIHTSSPACELHVRTGTGSSTTFGMRIANSGTNNNFWNFYTENSNAKLDLNANGALKGTFDATSGTYTALSDARLKKDVESMSNVLPSLMQLQVKKYHFNENKSDDRKYLGLIAQDVMNVFPEIVYSNQCDDGQQVYTMDYSAFGVLAVKAIQELNTVVAEKDVVISDLQKQIDEIKAGLQACGITCMNEAEKKSSANSTGSTLEQNIPNPANQTTTIRFSVPVTASDAQLIITDVNGKTIQQFSHLTIGQSQVEVSTLNFTAGTYQYSLYIDGRKVDTKQMIISK